VTSLRDTQELFWRLITAPEGVADGLRRIDMKPEELARVLVGDERLDAIARLDIYANMYFFRLHDILREDYSAVVAVVGDAAFHNLVTDYLLACPSTHPSVRNVGARLPAFLRTHALLAERPWLGELAALERARLEAFDAADADSLTLAALRTLLPDAYAALPLRLVPSHQLIEVQFAVDDVWRAVEHGQPPPAPAPAPRTLLVWRHALLVHHRALDPVADAFERAALSLAEKGASFGAVCDLLAERLPLEEAAPAAFALLGRWIADGLVAAP
jgi:hypothetical protein